MSEAAPSREPSSLLRKLEAVRRGTARVAAAMNYTAGWVYILCAFFVTADVLLRNFAGFSSRATTEITGYMLAFGISWGLAHALVCRAHIRVDVLVNRLPLGWRQYLHALALLLLAALATFFAGCAWLLVDESILFRATDTSALAIPLVIPQGLWTFGIAVFALTAAILCVEVVALLLAGRAREIDRLLGPRGYEEEAKEALEAVGLQHGAKGELQPKRGAQP